MTDNQPQTPLGTTTLPVSDREEVEALRAATLGHYDVLGELGRGGMATVYLAHDIALDRKVAIKVMSPVLSWATASSVSARGQGPPPRSVTRTSFRSTPSVTPSGCSTS
jgi:serine/threonine protein kinase